MRQTLINYMIGERPGIGLGDFSPPILHVSYNRYQNVGPGSHISACCTKFRFSGCHDDGRMNSILACSFDTMLIIEGFFNHYKFNN